MRTTVQGHLYVEIREGSSIIQLARHHVGGWSRPAQIGQNAAIKEPVAQDQGVRVTQNDRYLETGQQTDQYCFTPQIQERTRRNRGLSTFATWWYFQRRSRCLWLWPRDTDLRQQTKQPLLTMRNTKRTSIRENLRYRIQPGRGKEERRHHHHRKHLGCFTHLELRSGWFACERTSTRLARSDEYA